jgi:hypothetical protein
VGPLARTAAGGVRRHFEPAVPAENPCKSGMERTGIEPVTSGLQSWGGRSHPFALPAWLQGLRYGVPNPSEPERTLGVTTVPTKA